MAVVSMVGRVDKRILALPLIRACSIDGKTLVYTDDSNLKNLYQGRIDFGGIENVDINFDLNPEELQEENFSNDFVKHVFYVYSDYRFPESDIVIHCNNYNRKTLYDAEQVLESEHYEVEKPKNQHEIFFSSIPMKKNSNVIVLKPEYYNYLVETEEKKELQILKDKTINQLLANIMNGKIDMSKEQFFRLLTRKRIQLSLREGGKAKK